MINIPYIPHVISDSLESNVTINKLKEALSTGFLTHHLYCNPLHNVQTHYTCNISHHQYLGSHALYAQFFHSHNRPADHLCSHGHSDLFCYICSRSLFQSDHYQLLASHSLWQSDQICHSGSTSHLLFFGYSLAAYGLPCHTCNIWSLTCSHFLCCCQHLGNP